MADQTAFLYTGPQAVQQGVAPGVIARHSAIVVRGKVLTRDGAGLPGVRVTVLDHPEYGSTRTLSDGSYQLALNGGGEVTLAFERAGHADVQRTLSTPWQDYVVADSIVMIALDPRSDRIDESSAVELQVARGSASRDPDGARQATLLFPRAAAAGATMTLADGTSRPLEDLHVRATEYTVGDLGDAAMPGTLPPSSGYTYAVDFTVDEAEAAGATSVRFPEPVINYTENFIGAPVGSSVPTGSYDKAAGRWVAERDGRVVKVLRASGAPAVADVDSDGDGVADTGTGGVSFSRAERVRLAELYSPGTELWRVEIPHFTPWDHNWPYGPPPGARPPQLKWFNGEEPDPCWTRGSVIGCESQTLGERVPVAGTPFALAYQSDRVPGWRGGERLRIPVTGATLPPRLKGVQLDIDVAGRRFTQRWEDPANPIQGSHPEIPDITPNLHHDFTWDGRDAFGRPMQGSPTATVKVTYVYDFVYLETDADFERSFAQFPDDVEIFDGRTSCGNQRPALVDGVSVLSLGGGIPTRQDPLTDAHFFCGVPVSQTVKRPIGAWSNEATGLGSWDLDIHHGYDPGARKLHRGDGSTVDSRATGASLRTIAGGGSRYPDGASAPFAATEANLDYLDDVAVAPDGDVYALSLPCFSSHGGVRRIDMDGRIRQFAGRPVCGDPTGDGGPALDAVLGTNARGIAVGPDESVYIGVTGSSLIGSASSGYVRRIAPDGTISTIAGRRGDPRGPNGDGGPAREALIADPVAIDVGPDGRIYVSERGSGGRIRAIDPATGLIDTVAGGGSDVAATGQPATRYAMGRAYGVSFGPDGDMYVPDPVKHVVVRIARDGTVWPFAGTGAAGANGPDGGPATATALGNPTDTEVGPDGAVYIRTDDANGQSLIRVVRPDGTIATVAGARGSGGCQIPPAPAGRVCIFDHSRGLDIAGDGSLIVTLGRETVAKVGSPLPGFAADSSYIPAPEGGEVYEFSGSGRHLSTRDALTGAVRWRFTYDAGGRLLTVVDGSGNTTTIERSASGAPTAILAPGGQRTALGLDDAGRLATVANPAGETARMTYAGGGLLATFTDPRGGVGRFQYDEEGRLVRDESPSGRVQTLRRTVTDASTIVERTVNGERTTRYASETDPAGRRRTITDPTGARTVLVVGDDGTRTQIDPDGTRTTVTLGGDPRFGDAVPVVASEEVVTPSGRRQLSRMTRRATLRDPANPFSATSLDTTVSVTAGGQSGARSSTQRYDAGSRTLTRSTAEGRRNRTTLDALGRPVRIEPAEGRGPITVAYDARGRVNRVEAGGPGAKQVSSYAYDARNRATALTDGTGRTWRYAYDDADRLTRETLPDGTTHDFGHDAAGNLTSITMPNGAVHRQHFTAGGLDAGYDPPGTGRLDKHYDAHEELTRQSMPGGRVIENRYDAAGRLLRSAWTGPGGATVDASYSVGRDRERSIGRTPAAGASQLLESGYDGPVRTSLVASGAAPGRADFSYDEDLRLAGIGFATGQDAATTALDRDDDGLVTTHGPFSIERDADTGEQQAITDTGPGVLDVERDALGMEVSRRLTFGEAAAYGMTASHDAAGRVTRRVETVEGRAHTYDYAYDTVGRLTAVRRDNAAWESYAYDANGNRTTARSAGAAAPEIATYDEGDRLVRRGPVVYAFNDDGQLTARGADSFTYSARGELVAATVKARSATYAYDGFRRRVSSTVAGRTTRYFYADPRDPLALTASQDPSGALTRYHHDDQGRLFALERGGRRYWVATDEVGTPAVITDADGAVVKALDHDSFGRLLSDSAPAFELPIGFAGGITDEVTGLVSFGFRDYDPDSGRWTTRDPARFEGGQYNLYEYAGSSPVGARDPLGLGVGIGASFYNTLGIEAEVTFSAAGASACVGIGSGRGASLGVKTGDPVKRTGLYGTGELAAKYGPMGVSTKYEIDPCGEDKFTPLKATIGPFSIDSSGNVGVSGKPGSWDIDKAISSAVDAGSVKAEGKISAKYCWTSLD